MMRRPLYCAWLDLVARWWRIDRLRVSPREGELLRLQPGCVLTVNGIPAEVRGRIVLHERDGPRVVYECQTEQGPARLEVSCPGDEHRLNVFWSGTGRKEALFEHQIEVFG